MRNFQIHNLPKNSVPVPYRCVVLPPTYNGKSPYHFEFVTRNKRYISEWQGVNCPYVNYMVPAYQPYKELPKMFQIWKNI